jgi:hypothetical protein
MAISFIGANSAAGTSVAIPTHIANDVIFLFAHRHNGAAPTSPGAPWTTIDTVVTGGSGANQSGIFAWARAAAPGTTTGTWTNATDVQVIVLRGVRAAGNPYGNYTMDGENTSRAYIRYAAVNLTAGQSGQWIAAFGAKNTTQAETAVANAPTGMTNHSSAPATPYCAAHSTNSIRLTNWPATSVTQLNTIKYVSAVVEALLQTTGVPRHAMHYQRMRVA